MKGSTRNRSASFSWLTQFTTMGVPNVASNVAPGNKPSYVCTAVVRSGSVLPGGADQNVCMVVATMTLYVGLPSIHWSTGSGE